MSTSPAATAPGVTRFRTRLFVGMMLVVSLITAAVLYIAQQRAATDAENAWRATYESEVAAAQRVHELRRAALTERCRALVRRPRIHAAIEDNALDLLYPSARDELLDVLASADEAQDSGFALHATFYRFLDASGAVITPPPDEEVGQLTPEEERKLTLKKLPDSQQVGYLPRGANLDEVVAAPIISTETNEVIAALVLGFKSGTVAQRADGVRSGIWVDGQLIAPGMDEDSCKAVADQLHTAVGRQQSLVVQSGSERHRAFFTLLNSGSLFPPAYEVSCFPLGPFEQRVRTLRWQILGAGALLLLGGLAASHVIAGRLSVPVEQLAVDSEENRAGRVRAEAELEFTSSELQRSMRFSADASHQLKTPVTVLRAGLEELMQQPDLSSQHHEEISRLIFQTSRLSSMIHDLLLLSRVDGGRVELDLQPMDLTQLIDSLADDLSAVPSAPDFDVEVDVPRGLQILGEKRYTAVILQNLLENAWKYNQPEGRIAIEAHEEGEYLRLTVGNTGPGIPAEAQPLIFERFHRGAVGENVPGHGLGLNLARELARLHGGDLRLVTSSPQWTEFEVFFRLA